VPSTCANALRKSVKAAAQKPLSGGKPAFRKVSVEEGRPAPPRPQRKTQGKLNARSRPMAQPFIVSISPHKLGKDEAVRR